MSLTPAEYSATDFAFDLVFALFYMQCVVPNFRIPPSQYMMYGDDIMRDLVVLIYDILFKCMRLGGIITGQNKTWA